jgi:hypothetical protein
MAIIGIKQKYVNHDAIALVNELIPRLEAGEVVGLTLVLELDGGCYTTQASGTFSRLQTAGALLESAIRRVNGE